MAVRLPDVLVRPNESALLAHKLNKTSKFVSNVVYGAKRVNTFSLDIDLQKQVKENWYRFESVYSEENLLAWSLGFIIPLGQCVSGHLVRGTTRTVACPFISDTSPTGINREGLGKRSACREASKLQGSPLQISEGSILRNSHLWLKEWISINDVMWLFISKMTCKAVNN